MAVRGDVETLYRQCAPAVYKYLLCLTHDQALAEDLTADTFERALSGFERFRGDCTPTAWLCAIAKRLWYGELRRKRQALPLSEDDRLVSEEDIEREYVRREDKMALYRALRTLDGETREVFYLRLSGDMTFEEIGDIIGRSAVWARVAYYRGKEKLKERQRRDDE